jgi:hypothetical protein
VAVVSFNNGKHISLLTTEQQQGAIFWTTVAFCPGVMLLSLPKLAVVSLLTRILSPGRFHKVFLWTMVIWCQLTLFAAIGLLVGRCMPPRALWDFSVEGTCLDAKILLNYGIYAIGKLMPSRLLTVSALISLEPTQLSSIFIWLFTQPLSSFVFRCPCARCLLLLVLWESVLRGRSLLLPLP